MNNNINNKIAIFPGGFKPPHIGHYNILKKYYKKVGKFIIIISKKSRYTNNIEFNAIQSLKIWNIYINNLINKNKNYINNIKVIISNDISPLITGFKIITKKLNNNKKIILLKSEKNKSNARFSIFKKLENKIKINYDIIPDTNNISSTQMRKYIINKDIKKLIKYLPSDLNKYDINMIFKILKINVKI